jgi:membrane protein DedA with SNARE-associated domain
LGHLNYLVNLLSANSEFFIYTLICILLFLGGLGFPLPEDLILLAGGYLAYEGYTNIYVTIPVSIFGALVGDVTVYFIGRYFGEGFIRLRYIKKLFSRKYLVRISEYFKKHGDKTIFFARFIMGLRNPVYLVAGTLKIKFSRFLCIDSLGAFVSVPIVVGFGFIFGEQIGFLLGYINRVRYSILILFLLFCISWIIYKRLKLKKQSKLGI